MKTKTPPTDFSSVLFQRIEAFLEQPGRIQQGQWLLYGKALIILMLYGWTYFQLLNSATFITFMGFAALLGICHVLVPVNIVHDAAHSIFSKNSKINQLALLTLHLVGSNPFLFRKMHLKAHSDKESGSRRKAIETQELLMKKSNQRNLPIGFYLFYAFYMVFVRDFTLALREKPALTLRGWVSLIFPKSLYFTAIWIIPFIVIQLPAWQIFIGIFSIYFVIALLLIIILLMPTDPIEVVKQEGGKQLSNAWLKEVLNHNVDFSPESHLLNFIVGGSNMNVIHYLFPQVSHIHYVGMSRIIRETAAEYGMTYRHQGVWKVFSIHWRYMMELGRT